MKKIIFLAFLLVSANSFAKESEFERGYNAGKMASAGRTYLVQAFNIDVREDLIKSELRSKCDGRLSQYSCQEDIDRNYYYCAAICTSRN